MIYMNQKAQLNPQMIIILLITLLIILILTSRPDVLQMILDFLKL